MSRNLEYIIFMNIFYIILGSCILLWLWREGKTVRNENSYGIYKIRIFYNIIGFLPYIIEVILFLMFITNNDYVSFPNEIPCYYLIMGLAYCFSAYYIIYVKYKAYKILNPPNISIMEMVFQLGGLGIWGGVSWLFVPPIITMAHSLWYGFFFFIGGFLISELLTRYLISSIKQRIR